MCLRVWQPAKLDGEPDGQNDKNVQWMESFGVAGSVDNGRCGWPHKQDHLGQIAPEGSRVCGCAGHGYQQVRDEKQRDDQERP